jgi:hypothetical protein
MINADKLDAVHKFISSEFAGFTIESREEADRYRYDLRKANCRHLILVLKEFLDAVDAQDIETQLTNYSVAMIARGLGDMPILVTNSGCIFDRDVA